MDKRNLYEIFLYWHLIYTSIFRSERGQRGGQVLGFAWLEIVNKGRGKLSLGVHIDWASLGEWMTPPPPLWPFAKSVKGTREGTTTSLSSFLLRILIRITSLVWPFVLATLSTFKLMGIQIPRGHYMSDMPLQLFFNLLTKIRKSIYLGEFIISNIYQFKRHSRYTKTYFLLGQRTASISINSQNDEKFTVQLIECQRRYFLSSFSHNNNSLNVKSFYFFDIIQNGFSLSFQLNKFNEDLISFFFKPTSSVARFRVFLNFFLLIILWS